MRRQDSGAVKYCWPVSCWAVLTSQRRNSALQPSVALPRHAAVHQRLRVDGLPVLEVRRVVDVDGALDEGGLIDRREQPAALEVVGDDLRHADADFAVGRRARHEVRDRDRQRREIAFGNDDALLREGVAHRRTRQRAKRGHSGNDLTAVQTERHFTQSIFVGHWRRALCDQAYNKALWQRFVLRLVHGGASVSREPRHLCLRMTLSENRFPLFGVMRLKFSAR